MRSATWLPLEMRSVQPVLLSTELQQPRQEWGGRRGGGAEHRFPSYYTVGVTELRNWESLEEPSGDSYLVPLVPA